MVGRHRRARARRGDDRQLAGEGAHEGPCDARGRAAMAGVVRGLAAAHLAAREHDLVAGGPQQRLGVRDRRGQDQVAEAGREELDAHVRNLLGNE